MSAEEAKKTLSSGRSKVRISLSAGGKKLVRELTREAFEEMIEPYVYDTICLLQAAMDEAGLEYSDLDKILLAGGSTRIPMVKNEIYKETQIIPWKFTRTKQ